MRFGGSSQTALFQIHNSNREHEHIGTWDSGPGKDNEVALCHWDVRWTLGRKFDCE